MLTNEELSALYDTHRDEFLTLLRDLLRVKSVRSKQLPGAPFGEGPREVLDVVTRFGSDYGFKTDIVNDAMATITFGPDSDDYVGIVGHLDVVAAGDDGWHYPAFDLSEKDGRLYGRGILDNKGASAAVLFGMKLLKDAGYTPKKTLRLIYGSDEESGSSDVPLYLEQQPAPTFAFTPDCKFPAVYGERGIVNYTIETPISEDLKALGAIKGDQAKDHVPDDLTTTLNGEEIKAAGVRVPTNAPEQGVNAITELAKALLAKSDLPQSLRDYFSWIESALDGKHYGEGLEMAFSDPDSGKLIMTPYELQVERDHITLSLAMRYPVTFTEQDVTDALNKAVPSNSTVTVVRSIPGVLHDKNDPHISALTTAYEELTGLDGTPVTTTGATYSRAMPNTIAFGPSLPGQKGIAHKQDEWMDEEDLKLNMMIYIKAMIRLGEMTNDK